MGLRESRIINSVHPWLGDRLSWLGEVAALYGSRQSLISGNRTRQEQLRLYESVAGRPVAYPGCSQHQYGFAADAQYLPMTLISSKGRPIVFSSQDTTLTMNNMARHVGLTVVAGDDGHYQVFNGIEFKAWAVRRGLCNPNPPVSRAVLQRQSNLLHTLAIGQRTLAEIYSLGRAGFLPV